MILLKNKKTFIRILFYLIGRINVSKYFKIFPPYFYCISILFPFHTNAQSIDELLQIAASKNPGLKALEKEYLASLEKAQQVSQLPDPELGVGVFPLPVETRLGAQIIRVGATQMLPWPGTLDEKADLETTKSKAMKERITMQQIEVFFDLKKAWLKLYEIEKSQAVIRRNTQLLEALEQLALAKVESGKGTASDVLRVQLKTNELQQQLDILEVAKTAPTATINQLLNRDLDTPIGISDSLAFAPLPFDKATFSENISQNHPMLKMLAWQQQASRQSIDLNTLDSKPSFGVGLDYIMVNERTDAEPAHNGRDIVQLRGTVKIPLNKTRFGAKEQEEHLKIEAIELQKNDALSRFNALIERAYASYETARMQIDFYKKQKTITEAALRILESEYSAKGSRFDELLQLEKDLVEYDFKILKAVVESHLAKAEVERFVF
jgi:outer membrane protein TolC